MLMRDINLLLPSAIRTMRSSLRDVSRQQIPFTVDGLIRQGLPEKFASQVREAAKELGGERLVVRADTYMYSFGMEPNSELAGALAAAAEEVGAKVFNIGNSNRATIVRDAVHDGYKAAMAVI